MKNTERYQESVKDDIEKVKTGINKESALLRCQNLISKQELKSLKQITPITPIARPTLKTHKSPLKVRLIIKTIDLAFYKTSTLLSNELKVLISQRKSHIKDSEEFINKIKSEILNKNEKTLSFDISDMYPSLLLKNEVAAEEIKRI